MRWLVLILLLPHTAAIGAGPFGDQSKRESLVPTRAGVPGKSPFWNEHAKQFIWVPAFDFKLVARATTYRFTATASSGKPFTFEASEPWAPLAPIWSNLPVGTTELNVEALDDRGAVVGCAGTAEFHRGAAFNGPYGKPVVPYAQSARIALQGLMVEPFVQSWRTTGKPDPQYPLYRYASKVIGGLISGCALHAKQSPRPADADQAIQIARAAADF